MAEMTDSEVFASGASAPVLLSDEEVFGKGTTVMSDADVGLGTVSVGATLASLPERAWKGTVSGVTTTKEAFDFASSRIDPEMEETFARFPNSSAAQAYFARKREFEQSRRTGQLMREELKSARPAGTPGLFDEIVGGAAESFGASVVPTLALGAINPGLGAAAGLTTNFAMEAGGQYEEAQGKGATDEQTLRSMGFGGAVSTALETGPALMVKKIMETAGKKTLKETAKSAGKVLGVEALQEGTTQLALDTEANVSGWGNYTAGEMAHRTGVAAATGAVLGGVMGGGAHVLGRVKDVQQEVLQERALAKTLNSVAGLDEDDVMGQAIIDDIKSRPVDPLAARVQASQLQGVAKDVPGTEYGNALGAKLDAVVTGMQGPDVGGVTSDVEARREDYLARGLAGTTPMGEKIIMGGNNPHLVGLRLNQIAEDPKDLPDGAVVVLGGSALTQESLFPGLLPEGIGQAVTTLAQRAGITSPIIVTMEQLGQGRQGVYSQIELDDGRIAHVINPRELPSAKAKYGYGNKNAQLDFLNGLTHEFGHALKVEKFFRGLWEGMAKTGVELPQAAALSWELRQAIKGGTLSATQIETVRGFAPVEADLLTRWMELRTQALNGTIGGKDLALAWMGPRKFALSFDREKGTKSLWAWLERESAAKGRNKAADDMTAEDVLFAAVASQQADGQWVLTEKDKEYFLDFDEFMAEQFSRAANDRGYLAGTQLGKWFQSVLDALRSFFDSAKDGGLIKADETFNAWLDKQTATAPKKLPKKWGQVKLSKELKRIQQEQLLALEAERAQVAAEGELEVGTTDGIEVSELTEDEEAASSGEAGAESVLAQIETLVDMGILKEGSKAYKELQQLVKRGQVEVAADRVWDYISKAGTMKLDRDGFVQVPMTAQESWARLRFDSPWFKTWFRSSVIKDAISGLPLNAYHGSGGVIDFFDLTLSQFEKAFFFSASPQTAWSYAASQRGLTTPRFEREADARQAQKIRQELEAISAARDELRTNGFVKDPTTGAELYPDPKLLNTEAMKLQRELETLLEEAPLQRNLPTVGEYYLQIENPFELDFDGREWVRGGLDPFISEAKAQGHDGLIVRNIRDPLLDTIFIVFSPEQIKSTENEGSFGEHDRVKLDRDSGEREAALTALDQGVKSFDSSTMFRGAVNVWQRLMDALVQLQQRAAKPLSNGQLNQPLIAMLHDLQYGEAFKNRLQQPAEVLVKEFYTRSPKEREAIYAFLEAEWKSGKNWFNLEGWDGDIEAPNRIQIWGSMQDGGGEFSAQVGKQVKVWEFGVPYGKDAQERISNELAKVGIDPETVSGKELVTLILQYKNTMLEQFTQLERVLERKILDRWGATSIAGMELEKLYQSMQQIRLTPFFPQGRYGDYAIVVETMKEKTRRGERKWATSRLEQFETRAERDTALKHWHSLQKQSGGKLRATPRDIEEFKGIPLQLPRNLLEQISNTGYFTPEQVQVLGELMVPAGHERLNVRYGDMTKLVSGGEKDLVRNYANFIWHNANHIWKLDFRGKFAKRSNAQRAEIRRANKIASAQGRTLASELQRNLRLMERTKDYVLYPPNELQGLRTAVALAYLWGNVKTAIMNFGTMLNTYAAITTEYGEFQGNKLWAKGLWDASRLMGMGKSEQTKHIVGAQTAANSPLVWMYNRAVSEGVIDQSYAYFLAGQANGASMLSSATRSRLSQMGYFAQQVGMFPFRMVERMNRLATLTMFFEAERTRPGVGLEEAYQSAVQRTNLLQNAYDAANRSELFRGKKALLTMFASYTQFMTWNMMGGYAKGMRADLKARDVAPAQSVLGHHGYTVKLWLMYMLLGGLLAPPFAENLMEFIQWIWRKIYGTSARVELRKFIKELGWEPDLVLHGLLGNFGGMDLSGSFSMGRVIPGVDLLNRSIEDFQHGVGAMGVKLAGPFGGFTEDLVNLGIEATKWASGKARGGEVLATLPGAAGAVGKTYDAWVLQNLRPTGAVLDKAGARVVEDPPGSGKYRDLTQWELVGMLMGANPTVLARAREMRFMEVGENIYWRTKRTELLDNRFKALNTRDAERLKTADELIDKFNTTLPAGYDSLKITGRVKADSLKSHRRTVQQREQNKSSKMMRGPQSDINAAFSVGTEP